MLNVGIDAIAIATSPFYLDLSLLATQYNLPADKYSEGLGQIKMAIPTPDEDIVTLAARAAERALTARDKSKIGMLLFATESGIDQSKAAGLYVHRLLNLPQQCRVVELKQACYGATAALQLSLPWLVANPNQQVLLIASDIARYERDSAAESSQGCGAVAMLLSANPQILAIEPGSGVYAEDAMDFWRPNYRSEPVVDGRVSSKLYLQTLAHAWQAYFDLTKRGYSAHARFCYHVPVPKLVEKAHKQLLKTVGLANEFNDALFAKQVGESLTYCQQIGNCYSAGLYIALASLLDNAAADLTGQRIGLFSYGSGCVAEFFSGVIAPGYRSHLATDWHQNQLANRQALSYTQYLDFYQQQILPRDGSQFLTPIYQQSFRLKGINQHERLYEDYRSRDSTC